MSIGERQIQIINWVKDSLAELESSKIDSSLSSFCYFTSWAETPGYAKLKLKFSENFFIFKYLNILFKNFLAIASHSSYKVFSKMSPQLTHEVVIVSWSFKRNFESDGSFNDRYFNANSKDLPNAYWILISMDGYIPANVNDNIKIIKKKDGIFKYDIFSLIKILLSLIVGYKFSTKKLFHYSF